MLLDACAAASVATTSLCYAAAPAPNAAAVAITATADAMKSPELPPAAVSSIHLLLLLPCIISISSWKAEERAGRLTHFK